MSWYKKLRGDLKEQKFIFDLHNPCVANRIVRKQQHIIKFHVDNIMSNHKDKRVNNRFHKWLNLKYGAFGEVKTPGVSYTTTLIVYLTFVLKEKSGLIFASI